MTWDDDPDEDWIDPRFEEASFYKFAFDTQTQELLVFRTSSNSLPTFSQKLTEAWGRWQAESDIIGTAESDWRSDAPADFIVMIYPINPTLRLPQETFEQLKVEMQAETIRFRDDESRDRIAPPTEQPDPE